jgi:ribosomal protein S18
MAAITNEKIQKLQANFGEFIDYKKGWLMFKEAFVSSDGKIVLDPKESNSPSVALP